MIISHDKKLVFLAIPKTAGTSISTKIKNCCNDVEDVKGHSYDKFCKLSNSDYFRFTFVRNPWDRAVSSWKYIMHESKQKIEFKEFLRLVKYDQDNLITSEQMPLISAKWHVVEQHRVIDYNVKYIGRFETLQQDFDNICKLTGIPEGKLPEYNRRNDNDKGYRAFYDDKCIKLVSDIYNKDIKIFGYKFK